MTPRVDRVVGWIVGVWFVLLLVAHAEGYHGDPSTWGVSVFAFWPHAAFACATLALIAVVVWALARRRAVALPAASGHRGWPAWAPLAVSIAFGIACWGLRARHTLLGDGLAILSEPPGMRLHPLEPLSALIGQVTRLVLPAPAMQASAWRAAALTSAVAGAAFAFVAIAIARQLAPRAGAAAALLAVALLAQGGSQVFFGYVENYALATLGAALYTLVALRAVRGTGSLLVCGLTLGLALALHLGAAAYAPSFVVVAAVSLREPATRARARRDLVMLALAAAVALVAVAALAHGYNAAGQLGRTLLDVLRGDMSFRPGYRGSAEHLRDFLNGQALAGPIAALLFVPLAIRRAAGRRWSAETVFLGALGLGALAASAIAGDSNLGYARNWDLMAPYAFVTTAAALGLLVASPTPAVPPRAAMIALAAMSLYHTVPWIALNHSTDRSIARFETLPLGFGRVESTLGYWYVISGDDAAAERWYTRALNENPTNLRAHLGLASIYRSRGDAVGELLALRESVRLRPADERARWRLLDALVRGHAWDAAALEAGQLVGTHPDDPSIALAHAVTLALAGREAEARGEAGRAARSAGQDTALVAGIAEVRAASHDTAALSAIWARRFGVPDLRVP